MNLPGKAEEKFRKGYNCAQSVFSTYASSLGMDEKDAENVARAFGGGINGRAELCGAVSGALMAIGVRIGKMPIPEYEKKEVTKQ